MKRFRRTAAIILLGCGLSGGRAEEPVRPPAGPPPTAEQIAAWVTELDSDSYLVRKTATERLQAGGLPVVAALEPVLEGSSLEATTRAVLILQELALSTDAEVEEGARQSLERAAKERVGSVSRRAAAALGTLNQLRRDRAMEELKRLGARPEMKTIHNGFEVVEVVTGIEIGTEFTGTERDLRRLEWIGTIPQLEVKLIGRQVTDEWLKPLVNVRSLSAVTLNRCSVTDGGLAELKKLDRLVDLSIWNTPVSDAAVEHLQACRGLTNLKLYGTKITPQGVARVQQGLGVVKIDFRRGAFLGVGGTQTPQGCEVQVIHPNSAAEKAGVMVGDVIVRIGEKRVADFESLTQIVSQMSGGETAEFELLRNDEKVVKRIKFGEWGE